MSMVVPSAFRHEQTVASDTWVINHGIGANGSGGVPIVDVLWDNAGTLQKIVPAGITITSQNVLTITFTTPRAGQAIIVI